MTNYQFKVALDDFMRQNPLEHDHKAKEDAVREEMARRGHVGFLEAYFKATDFRHSR